MNEDTALRRVVQLRDHHVDGELRFDCLTGTASRRCSEAFDFSPSNGVVWPAISRIKQDGDPLWTRDGNLQMVQER